MRLQDLGRLRSAPPLTSEEQCELEKELSEVMQLSLWFTVGIMASSTDQAVQALRTLEEKHGWLPHKIVERPEQQGPVYLKANQRTCTARIRIEHGLAEGILISGHYADTDRMAEIWGPFPLEFFETRK